MLVSLSPYRSAGQMIMYYDLYPEIEQLGGKFPPFFLLEISSPPVLC